MLSREDNALVTRVGPGTPMGALMRRFWVPALMSRQVAEADGPPVRVRILGEQLVAFRDTSGRVSFVAEHCPHRGASLFFGRNEEAGLRCVYHGWKFDTSGACVDMPNEPPESNFKNKMKVAAYPGREQGGLVWIYMGPPELQPELPQLEWTLVPDDHRAVICWLAECNWLQALEGDIDTSHSMFLHRAMDPALMQSSRRFEVMADRSPRLATKHTDYGMAYGGRYNTHDGNYNWRVTQWLMPFHTIIANKSWPVTGRAWVPIDDHHTAVFSYRFRPDRPMTEPEIEGNGYGQAWEREHEYGPVHFKDGGATTIWRPVTTRANDYLMDREMQRTRNYTGIFRIPTQDRAMTEGMGAVMDRTRERLGTSDLAIISVRRRLIRMARDLERGEAPTAPYNGGVYRIRSFDAISEHGSFDRFLEQHREGMLAPV
ncbi:MAG: Rieske 2Fe-2S domain-containing protein [Chloroflexota bacterium]